MGPASTLWQAAVDSATVTILTPDGQPDGCGALVAGRLVLTSARALWQCIEHGVDQGVPTGEARLVRVRAGRGVCLLRPAAVELVADLGVLAAPDGGGSPRSPDPWGAFCQRTTGLRVGTGLESGQPFAVYLSTADGCWLSAMAAREREDTIGVYAELDGGADDGLTVGPIVDEAGSLLGVGCCLRRFGGGLRGVLPCLPGVLPGWVARRVGAARVRLPAPLASHPVH